MVVDHDASHSGSKTRKAPRRDRKRHMEVHQVPIVRHLLEQPRKRCRDRHTEHRPIASSERHLHAAQGPKPILALCMAREHLIGHRRLLQQLFRQLLDNLLDAANVGVVELVDL